MSVGQTQVGVVARSEPWPPADTEESIVGSEYHQHVIDAARDSAGRLKPLPQEADALLLEQEATLERIRELAAAGDLAALRAFLAQAVGDDNASAS